MISNEARIIIEAAVGLAALVGFQESTADRGGAHRFYVYALLDDEGAAHYIGKGTGSRIGQHETEARDPTKRMPKHAWIRRQWALGKKILRCRIATELLDAEAYALEAELIELLGLENLKNVTPGGVDGFLNLPEGYRRMVIKARAKMRGQREKPWVATNYIQRMIAIHPQATKEEIKELLIAHREPWHSANVKTKNKGTLLTLIHKGGRDMFSTFGVITEIDTSKERQSLMKAAIENPGWSVPKCLEFAQENGFAATTKDPNTPVADMRGVFRMYASQLQGARQKKAINPSSVSNWSEAPDANPDQEGLSTHLSSPAKPQGDFGHNGGPVWSPTEF